MEQIFGVIKENATVLAEDGTIHNLPVRGTDINGFSEILIDATAVGGDTDIRRQSIKPFIGMKVEFTRVDVELQGFDFKIIS
jgi:hypothetical protein